MSCYCFDFKYITYKVTEIKLNGTKMMSSKDPKWRMLVSAVHKGNIRRVKDLIESYGLNNIPTCCDGYILLRDSLQYNHPEVAKLLLEKEAKVESKSKKLSNTPLHFAVINGDLEVVNLLLDKGACIVAKNGDGRAPLHHAVEKQDIPMIKLLLERKAFINTRDDFGLSPLCIAAEKGNYEIVDLLLTNGAFPNFLHNIQYGEVDTPLHLAVDSGRKDIAELLVSRGAKTDVRETNGWTPLHIAVQKNNEEIAEILLTYGADPNVDCNSADYGGYTPLHFACDLGNEGMIQVLLNDSRTNVNALTKKNQSALDFAISKGFQNIIIKLLDRGSNIFIQGSVRKTILDLAVEKGWEKIVDHIIKHCVDCNNGSSIYSTADENSDAKLKKKLKIKLGYTFKEILDRMVFHLIYIAADKNYWSMCDNFLKYTIAINKISNLVTSHGFTLLHKSVINKQEKIVERLIKYGANVQGKDEHGKSPLSIAIDNDSGQLTALLLVHLQLDVAFNTEVLNEAVRKGSINVIKTLIEQHDANVDANDVYGRTALHYTVINENGGCTDPSPEDDEKKAEIAALILYHGADVNAKTPEGETTLHFAALKGYSKVLNVLLQNHADKNCTEESNFTPLHTATENGHADIVEILSRSGADLDVQDVDGRTALHIAVDEGYKEIVQILLKYGAFVNILNNLNETPLQCAEKRIHVNNGVNVHGEIADLLRERVKIKTEVESDVESDVATDVEDNEHPSTKMEYVNLRIMTTNSAWLQLSSAVQLGNLSKVRTLLREEDDLADLSVWADGYTLLRDAIEDSQLEIVEHLLENNISVNRKSKNSTDTPLHLAIHIGGIDLITLLLDKGAKVTAKGKCKKTPLHVAFEYSKIEIIELLIAKRGDLNAKDQDGLTPMCLAVKKGRLEIVDYFLNHEKYQGQLKSFATEEIAGVDTPLHLAAASGNKDLVIYFIKAGARINVQGINLQTPLHIAIQKNHESVVECLLDHGADLQLGCIYCDENNCTALHIAADLNNEKIANLLLNKGASIHALSIKGLTPLHIAACRNNVECIKILLNNQEFDDVNYLNIPSTDEGNTALHFATMFGCYDVMKLLLEMKADINIYSFEKMLPIHIAVTKGNEKIVELLLNYGSDPDTLFDNNKTLLSQAVEFGDFKVVEQILKFHPDITNEENIISLKNAVQSFNEESQMIVEALLDYGFKIDVNDPDKFELVRISVEKGLTRIVNDFLQAGFDVNQVDSSSLLYQSCTFLHIAVRNKQCEMIKLLLNNNAITDIEDSFGYTPMSYAIESGELDIIKVMLEHITLNYESKRELLFSVVKKSNIQIIELILQFVIDVNIADQNGRTALHVIDLMHSGSDKSLDDRLSRREIVNFLISKGGNVNARTKKNDTVLDYAILYQNPYVLEELLMQNANTNYLNYYGDTPLGLAAIKGNSKIVELLIHHNVDVNAPNYKGITPLFYAVENNNEEAIKCLLDNGACINWKYQFNGETVLHMAVVNKKPSIVALLLKYGADINITNFRKQTPLSYAIQFPCDVNNIVKIIYIFREHMIKLKCANLYVNEIDFKFIISMQIDNFSTCCMNEIDRLKETKIVDTRNFFYNDILAMNTQKLSVYLQDNSIVENFRKNESEYQYPIYHDLLKKRFNDGMERKEILLDIDKYLTRIFPDLPYNCVTEVFYYLFNDTLRQLISANSFKN
ncbi:serine/threonine-protein phosphatase 6 regulatory ankyrin repeat subunit B-like [Cotesia glomerata]|uniref:serine/threonine-protein phosphatase 6 regulatory ankyrin repeat subunit B-like n=1 Tax=Cotesia glomerata TaxID=32391 RepID=UPI001D0158ED|nr:serine/threonine-protein phosphatase 6 regulatory ankyrin repeat subunit B-like [Cotesia glomerata]